MTPNTIALLVERLKFWESDPLPLNKMTMTKDQEKAYLDPKNCVLIEGGNQSGKSRTTVMKTVGFALEDMDGCFPGQDVIIWYCTTTYDAFAGPAWDHFKSNLFFPGESPSRLPSTHVEAISWLGKTPEKPNYFCIRRPSGFKAHVHVKSYEAGRKEFQGRTVHMVVLDEEAPEDLFTEVLARMFASRGAKLVVCCTPVEGEEWLDVLRKDADEGRGSRYMLKTMDNPMVNQEVVNDLKRRYANAPEELQLRLLGVPRVNSGLVYKDTQFTQDHILDAKYFDHTHWTLNRAIDAGYRHPSCVWMAVSPDEKQIVIYRTWKGENATIAQAAAEIRKLSGPERYYWDIIDPAVCQTNAETGKPEIDVWRSHGIEATPAPDNRVYSGIERVWELMAERVEIPDHEGFGVVEKPRFRVVREACGDWLDERRKYRFKDIVKDRQRDAIDFRPVKQNDHLMDATRYLIAAGLRWVPEKGRPPAEGTTARMWYDMRHKKDQKKKR